MANLQQMNETAKQSSQFFLQDGYVTMNGKRYDECVPFEQEAFNVALQHCKADETADDELSPMWADMLKRATEPLMAVCKKPQTDISDSLFELLLSKLPDMAEGDPDGWVSLSVTYGVYTLQLWYCYATDVVEYECFYESAIDDYDTHHLTLTAHQVERCHTVITDAYDKLRSECAYEERLHREDLKHLEYTYYKQVL